MNTTYYVAGIPYSAELYHHGIKGQKWGIRRFQNEDGSLTSEGFRRYNEMHDRFKGAHLIESSKGFGSAFGRGMSSINKMYDYMGKHLGDIDEYARRVNDKYGIDKAVGELNNAKHERDKHKLYNLFVKEDKNKYSQRVKKAERYLQNQEKIGSLEMMERYDKMIKKLPKRYRNAGYSYVTQVMFFDIWD